jgi:outer membrane protein assembly factor BamE (lipoprotein component of BamABCDE complex)
MNWLRVAKLLCISFICAGCIILPIPTKEHYCNTSECNKMLSRRHIPEDRLDFINVGKTTKEEILLKIGEPDWSSNEDNTFEYHWSMVKGYVVIIIVFFVPYGGASGTANAIPWVKKHYFLIQFDDQNKVRSLQKGYFKGYKAYTEE